MSAVAPRLSEQRRFNACAHRTPRNAELRRGWAGAETRAETPAAAIDFRGA
jgi:hypothetical protein